jgi:hypothetical protein
VVLAAMDERGVDAERDVVQEAPLAGASDVHTPLLAVERVQRGERVVAVEPDVAGEVVARAEGDDDERQVALDGDRRHARDRAVAAGGGEHLGVGVPRELGRVVALAEHVHLDSPFPRRLRQLLGGRALAAGARVDQQQRPHGPHGIGHGSPQVRPNGSLRRTALVPIMHP